MKNLKQSKMNKFSKQLVLGLSCIGILSAASCDNDHNETREAPILEKVGFPSATVSNAGLDSDGSTITFAAGDKIKLYIVEGDATGTKAATYYTDDDRQTGITFKQDNTSTDDEDETTVLTFKADDGSIAIEKGFYLASATGDGKAYTLKQFDIIENGKTQAKYVLKGDYPFKVKTGAQNSIAPVVVDLIAPSVTGRPSPRGTEVTVAPSFKDITGTNHHFDLTLEKSDGNLFNSTNDSDFVIALTVKDGTKEIYKIDNLFTDIGETESTPKKFEIFTLNLPRELSHYSNDGDNLTIIGTATKGDVSHDFNIKSGTIKSGNVVLKVQ